MSDDEDRTTAGADDDRDDWDPPTVGQEDDWKPEADGTSLPGRVSERMQERLGVSAQQWFVIESILVALPYPLFVYVYLTFSVPPRPFFVLTGLYTAFVLWFSFWGDPG